MIGETKVLTHALVLKRLANGGHVETQPRMVRYDDGDTAEVDEDVTIVHYAEPGEVIDVSAWSDIQAYVNQGWIQLLTPDQVEQYEAKQQQGVKTNDRRTAARN